MAIQDCTRFLGKRVGYTVDFSRFGLPSEHMSGRIIAIFKYAHGYEDFDDGSVLFLRDGYEEPDFISSEYDFSLIE